MGQVAEVILEGRESGDDLTLQPEGRHAVGYSLLCLGNNVEDRSPESF
jgi:hypothetical protein